jgi:hypothetical protein
MTIYECDCNNCGHVNDINNAQCDNCGLQLPGTINTRRASIRSEVLALDQKYSAAITGLKANGLEKETNELVHEINTNGKAIINTNIDFLWEWLVKGSGSYVGYKRLVINNSRPKAKFENDVKRTLHDSILFGSADLIYSALTIDEQGLTSYGEATIILKIPSIQNRTSALETNSYFFVEEAVKLGWTIDKPLPAGFMSTWFTKDKLGVSKLEKRLKKGMQKDEMARLILTSYGNRSTDEFIELYIFGKIVETTIEKIKIPSSVKTSSDYRERLKLSEIGKKFNIEYC